MDDRPTYVVSDIHLGAVPAQTERAFREFLQYVARGGGELLINGDLFDFWFEYGSVIQSRHYRVLAALTDLREAGVRIRFLPGNHDAWGGEFLRREIGIEMVEEGAEIDLGGRRTLVVHGDGVGGGDLGYKALKRIIRSPISTGLFRLLHPDLGSRIAAVASTTDAKLGTPELANPVRAAALERWAVAQLERRPELDLVLAGHTHTPRILELGSNRFYVNTGDWLNHFTYLVLPSAGRPDLRRWAPT